MKITVKSLSGTPDIYNIDQRALVADLKHAIHEKNGIEIDLIRLLVKGKQLGLLDSLESYNITEGSVVTLSVKKVKKKNVKERKKSKAQTGAGDVSLKERLERRLKEANESKLNPGAPARSVPSVSQLMSKRNMSSNPSKRASGPIRSISSRVPVSTFSNLKASDANDSSNQFSMPLTLPAAIEEEREVSDSVDQTESSSTDSADRIKKHKQTPASKPPVSRPGPKAPPTVSSVIPTDSNKDKSKLSDKRKNQKVHKTALAENDMKPSSEKKSFILKSKSPVPPFATLDKTLSSIEINDDDREQMENISKLTLVSAPSISNSAPVISLDMNEGNRNDNKSKRRLNEILMSGPSTSNTVTAAAAGNRVAGLAMKPSSANSNNDNNNNNDNSNNNDDDAYRKRIESKLKGAGMSGPSTSNTVTAAAAGNRVAGLAMKPSSANSNNDNNNNNDNNDDDDAYRKRIESKLKGAGMSGPSTSNTVTAAGAGNRVAGLAMKPSSANSSNNNDDDAYRKRIESKLKGAGTSGPLVSNSKAEHTEFVDIPNVEGIKSASSTVDDTYRKRMVNKLSEAGAKGPIVNNTEKPYVGSSSSVLKLSNNEGHDAIDEKTKRAEISGPSSSNSTSPVIGMSSVSSLTHSSSKDLSVNVYSSINIVKTDSFSNKVLLPKDKVENEGNKLILSAMSVNDPLDEDKSSFVTDTSKNSLFPDSSYKGSIKDGVSFSLDSKDKSMISFNSSAQQDSWKDDGVIKGQDIGTALLADVHFDEMLPISAEIYDDDEFVIGGLVVDEDQENYEIEESKKLATNRLICITVLIVVVIVAIFVPISTVFFKRKREMTQPSLAPSSTPSLIPSSMPSSDRFSQFSQAIINAKVTDSEMLLDQESPQYTALIWIADVDQVDVNARNMIQRYVLAVLYFALGGDNWNICARGTNCACLNEKFACMTIEPHHIDQLSLGPECDWYRIKCDEDGWVTHMLYGTAPGNNLRGQIPSEINHLEKLVFLDLQNNQITGILPDSFDKLKALKDFTLNRNQMTGTIPDTFYELSSLMNVELRGNEFSGSISTMIGKLYSLRRIVMDNNNFSGSIPTEFGNVTDLREITLWENNFTGTFPDEIMRFEFLRIIETRNNRLSGTIPQDIHENSNLRNISFGHNMMNGTVPETIYNASLLTFLNLADNEFSGTISEKIESLALLDLSLQNNFFSGTIPTLSNPSLDVIELHGNNFTGTLPESICDMERLEVFTFDCWDIICSCLDLDNLTDFNTSLWDDMIDFNNSLLDNITDDLGSSDFA